MTGDNHGIQHTGTGDIRNDGVQAVGPHAQASGVVRPAPAEEVPALLAELRARLGELAGPDREYAAVQLDAVAEEVGKPAEARTPGRAGAALAKLAAAVGAVTALATKAESLRHAVEQLFG